MKQAATLDAADHMPAARVMQRSLGRFTADAMFFVDPALDPEVKRVQDLIALIQRRAPQGNLYGQ